MPLTLHCFSISLSYEKMISGKYLGELVRQSLLKLIQAGVVFGGSCSEEFKKFEAFNGYYVTEFETGCVNNVQWVVLEGLT